MHYFENINSNPANSAKGGDRKSDEKKKRYKSYFSVCHKSQIFIKIF